MAIRLGCLMLTMFGSLRLTVFGVLAARLEVQRVPEWENI
jgi:hypothetical protein